MSDEEPLYCRVCGAEDCWCDHSFEDDGPYCDVCGIIPAPGQECIYMKAGGRRDGCKGAGAPDLLAAVLHHTGPRGGEKDPTE